MFTAFSIQVAKITGEEWKNMTEEQRGPYEEVSIHRNSTSKTDFL